MTKYMFYSSDFHGIGHFTRNFKIVLFLSKYYNTSKFYIVTNKKFVAHKLPKNVKILLMPHISLKQRPRNIRYKEVLPEEVDIWAKHLIKLVSDLKPNIFYSDLNPNGGYGELRKVFPFLKKNKIKTIIGLRDILDDKAQTFKEWMTSEKDKLSIFDYDKILVFGEKEIFKKLYSKIIKNINRIDFTGYLLPEKGNSSSKTKPIDIFAMFGGGGKAVDQVSKISHILNKMKSKRVVILTGPSFPIGKHKQLQRRYTNIKYVKSSKNVKKYLQKSKLVITHCGYNSIMEALGYCGTILLCPRFKMTRKEQLYRARYFKRKNFCDYFDYRANDSELLDKIVVNLVNNKEPILISSGLNKNLVNLFKFDQ